MFIDGLVNSDEIPVLETSAKFAARYHTMLAHNIANASTPNFQPMEASVADFRKHLGEAIDARRERRGAMRHAFEPEGSREVSFSRTPSGEFRLELRPSTPSGNVLFHDRNSRDLERMMQGLAENAASFRTSIEMLRSRMQMLSAAIALRV